MGTQRAKRHIFLRTACRVKGCKKPLHYISKIAICSFIKINHMCIYLEDLSKKKVSRFRNILATVKKAKQAKKEEETDSLLSKVLASGGGKDEIKRSERKLALA